MIKNHNSMGSSFTSHPSKYPQKQFKPKDCRWCGKVFNPTGPSHHYCTDPCRKQVYIDKHYKRNYGVGYRWVIAKLEEQEWKCGVCKSFGFKMREDHISGLNLDHCHTTGKVRALLCHNCNRGLGLFQDNPEYLRSAANYIEVHNEFRADEKTPEGGAGETL